jgi:hypothetical protein
MDAPLQPASRALHRDKPGGGVEAKRFSAVGNTQPDMGVRSQPETA